MIKEDIPNIIDCEAAAVQARGNPLEQQTLHRVIWTASSPMDAGNIDIHVLDSIPKVNRSSW